MATAPQHYLVSFENVAASVGGYDISSIAEMHISASANSVPQITLAVDAANSGAGIGAAEHVSLDNARTVFDVCRSMVKTDGATLSLSMTCHAVGPAGEEEQQLDISGWPLTDVAFTPVQEEGVCLASLTFQHPICKAHFGGFMPGFISGSPDLATVKGANPFAAFTEAIRAYGNMKAMETLPTALPGMSQPARVRAVLRQRLFKAVADLEASVSWTHGGLPAAGRLGGWGMSLVEGFARTYAAPGGGNSILQILLGSLVPECSLALGGDYTKDKLELGPFEPWADATLRISERDILSVDLPQSDPNPISGVCLAAVAQGGGFTSYFDLLGIQGDTRPADVFYIPDSELKAPYMYGPIQQFTMPGWLQNTVSTRGTVLAGLIADITSAQEGLMETATTMGRNPVVTYGGGAATSSSVEYSSAAAACAKAYFETSFMKDWSFTVTARLLFSAGGTICPGRVMAVSTASGDVLTGYVSHVEHGISVANGSAVTKIVCTHPRFGRLPAAITSPKNALYN